MRTVDFDLHSQNDSQSRSRACAVDRRRASVAHFLAKTASLSSSVHHPRAIVAPCSIDPRDGGHGRLAILVRDVVVPAPSGSRPASPVAVTVPVTVVSRARADADRARHQGLPVSARCPVSLHHSFIRETSGSGTPTVHSPRLRTHQPAGLVRETRACWRPWLFLLVRWCRDAQDRPQRMIRPPHPSAES